MSQAVHHPYSSTSGCHRYLERNVPEGFRIPSISTLQLVKTSKDDITRTPSVLGHRERTLVMETLEVLSLRRRETTSSWWD